MDVGKFMLVAIFCVVDAADILIISAVLSHSHALYTNVLTEALAARGHKLVVLTADELTSSSKITSIYLEGGYDAIGKSIPGFQDTLENFKYLSSSTESFIGNTNWILKFNVESCRSLLYSVLCVADAADILVISTVLSHSHALYTNVLTEALATRGHKLVVLSADELRSSPNVTSIYLEGGYAALRKARPSNTLEDFKYSSSTESFIRSTKWILKFSVVGCRSLLFSEGNKQFYKRYKNATFDLIIADVAGPECFLKYAQVFGNPPIIGYTAFFSRHAMFLSDSENPAYIPHFMSTLTDRMNFWERLINWFQYKYYDLKRHYWMFPILEKMSGEFFGIVEPRIEELDTRLSLVLVNDHFSMTQPTPLAPSVIPVAGLHIKPVKPLPKDIEKFISEAKHGVIYFSLGSNFFSNRMEEGKKRMFLDAFAQLQQRVLWKYEDDTLSNIPQNVMLRKWLPQTDILAHNNTVLFITHNGYLSTQESVHFGVPMLGIPLILDQFKNSVRVFKKGIGLSLDLNKIHNSQQILDKIKILIENPSYKQNAQKLSAFFRDRPMSPLDTAIYWIEYVLRHKGANHLKLAGLNLHWFQYYLLDVYLAILIAFYTLYIALAKLVDLIIKTQGSPKIERKKL
nr:PREDICTED: UDP-glucuronosyltransferase 2B13-like isoform X2 [Bemisia tabaci]